MDFENFWQENKRFLGIVFGELRRGFDAACDHAAKPGEQGRYREADGGDNRHRRRYIR